MNFAKDIEINKFDLPTECEQHAGRFHEVSDLLADAKSDLNDAEDKLKLVLAEREQFYRLNWSDTVWGKQTEGSIKSKVETDQDVIDQKKEVADLQRKVNTYDAAKGAFDHRKSMLNNLVSLLIGGFYAAPEGSRQESTTADKDRALRRKRKEQDEDE